MVTQRNFLTITIMMSVLFFMFQFSGVIKEVLNDYEVNEYEEDTRTTLTEKDSYSADISRTSPESSEYFVYIGNVQDSAIGAVAEEWCSYVKRDLITYESVQESMVIFDYQVIRDSQVIGGSLPEAILLDPDYLELADITLLMEYVDEGVNLIFCKIPAHDFITGNQEWRELLGISEVRSGEEMTSLAGIWLHDGFLLGGGITYRAETDEDVKRQDLDLEVTWYVTGSRTKTYMTGEIEQYGEEKKPENEELPAIIWRNSVAGAKIFVVNGDYLEDSTGLGLLSAIMSEMYSYYIYPVVNAQNVVYINYPGAASENNKVMQTHYSRNQKEVYRDIIWSGIAALASATYSKVTCMMSPQLDYEDVNEPGSSELIYYMKLLREQNMEIGLSSSQVSDLALSAKLDQDFAFLNDNVPAFSWLSFYVGSFESGAWEDISSHPLMGNIRTLLRDYESGRPVISYAEEDITLQSAVNTGSEHTYSENLLVRSVETALGYSAVAIDIIEVAYPESEAYTWEKVYGSLSSNLIAYWEDYKMFDETTLTESDKKIREFLALRYSHERVEDVIYLDITGFNENVSFILRTHEEKITGIKGAEFTEIEEGAWLIKAKEAQIEISLTQTRKPYYY